MNYGEIMANINYIAVFVAAISAFVVGWLWYDPLFGKKWMKLNGFTEESLKEGGMSLPLIMIINYVVTALAAFGIAFLLAGHDTGVSFGILIGIMITVFWIATNRFNDVLYERKPLGLYFINVGYNLVIYAVMGAILGAWQ